MRRFLFKSILLSAIITFSVWITGLYDNMGPARNHNVARVQEAIAHDSLDYLFAGNSYTYSGINPQYFDSLGLETFNLGVSTAGVYFYELVVDDYLEHIDKMPENILMLISPMTFSEKADAWASYPIHRHLNNAKSNLYIFGFYNLGPSELLKSMRKSSLNGIAWMRGLKGTAKQDAEFYKGFYFDETTFNDSIYRETKHLYESLIDNDFPVDKLRYLIELAVKYKRLGINIIFHEAPSNVINQFYSEEFLADYQVALEAIKDEGFEVLPGGPELDGRYFRNIDHLNTLGAKRYTGLLIKQLGY